MGQILHGSATTTERLCSASSVDFGFNVRLGEFENSKPYGK